MDQPSKPVTADADAAYQVSVEQCDQRVRVVFSGEQTRGKGRLGRDWHSPQGLGLWFSIILRPAITACQ